MQNKGYYRGKLGYWKSPEKGFPRKIWWKVIAGNRKLSILEEYDVVFDEYDLRIRKLLP